jgi:hypothetical protein
MPPKKVTAVAVTKRKASGPSQDEPKIKKTKTILAETQKHAIKKGTGPKKSAPLDKKPATVSHPPKIHGARLSVSSDQANRGSQTRSQKGFRTKEGEGCCVKESSDL